MTQSQTTASYVRWIILFAALACWLCGLFWVINVSWPHWEIFSGDFNAGAGLIGLIGFYTESEGAYWAFVAVYLAVFLTTQWLFLAPRGNRRIELTQTGRPLRRSVIVAALMSALLTVGLLATIAELAGVWKTLAFVDDNVEKSRYWPSLLALAVSWAVWAAVFFIYWRKGDRMTQFQRMLRGLLAGSILELLVSAPVHVLALQSSGEKENCYCARGSYTGLIFGGTVLLWAFGPGVVLLFLREKARRTPLLTP